MARKKLLHVASILYIQAKLPVKINLNYLQLSKNLYIKKLSSPNWHNCLAFRFRPGIKSVSGEDTSLKLLGLEPTLDLLHHFASQFRPRKVMRSLVALHFLAGAAEVVDAPLNWPMCALIIATFSAFFPLKVILWWEKYKDSSSTLKDESLSELYSPAQSMSLYCRFSRSIQSLSVSSFCAFLSWQGAQHTLPLAFRGQCIYLKTF